jgi:cytoskeletal protein CcmA (bactofilin family)
MTSMRDKDLTGIQELQALLGRGTEFDGKLTFEGRVRIDGVVRGPVFGKDVLILGPTAEVHADIDVGALIVRGGAIWGEIRAERLVELYAPARVYGDITTTQLYLDKGVTFEGRCKMLEPPAKEPEPEPADAETGDASRGPEQTR